jgi:hypothetical protein
MQFTSTKLRDMSASTCTIVINIALLGHTDPNVHDKYGAKDKAIRFRHRLAEAIASVTYAGLDLSHLSSHRAAHVHQRPPNAEGSRRGGGR